MESDKSALLLKPLQHDEKNISITIENNGRLVKTENDLREEIGKLLEAVLENKPEKIDDILKVSKEIVKHKYVDHSSKDILLIACTYDSVSADTLNGLYLAMKSNDCNYDYIDEEWYGWEPLHYVARTANPEKLQIVINNLKKDYLNCLTIFSENAFHVLLRYEKSVTPFNTVLVTGRGFKSCTIVSTEKERTIKCAKILIDAGIDVNHTNFWGETPLSLAARYRFRKTIQMLLMHPYIDLDNSREAGKSLREYLKANLIITGGLPSNVIHEKVWRTLFSFLKCGKQDSFLMYNNMNIREYANYFDGDNKNCSSCGTMLQFCFRKGFLEYVSSKTYNVELTKNDIMDSPMLRVFRIKGMRHCIEHLLDNGANPNLTSRKFKETLLEAAAVRGYYPLVAMLLEHKNGKANSEDMFHILPKLFEEKYQLKNHGRYRRHVLFLLLTKLNEIHGKDKLTSKKLSILNKVLLKLNIEGEEEKEDDKENICQILLLGASLASKDGNGKMVVESIHKDILKAHLDDTLDGNTFCYNSLIEDGNEKYSETSVISFLANDPDKSELLAHPVLIHFIHNKWLRIYWFFYLDLILYTAFLLSIYAFMIDSHLHKDTVFIKTPFYALLIFHIIKETVQLILLYHFKYFKDVCNYFELTVVVSCAITIFFPNQYSMVLAILFSTLIFFMMLGQLPVLTKYTIIFGSAKYFLEYTGFYFIQFVSFALCFYLIFPFEIKETKGAISNDTNHDTIKETAGDIFKSLFYTLIYFTGEFSDRVLEPEQFPIFGRVVMTLFIFCMTIILNNLLVGLIVADMGEMQKIGKQYRQIKMAEFISRTSSIIKRLHEFKSIDMFKKIIHFLEIFKKNHHKLLDISKCAHKVFDEEDIKYVKDIKNGKYMVYDEEMLRKLYEIIIDEHHDFESESKERQKDIIDQLKSLINSDKIST